MRYTPMITLVVALGAACSYAAKGQQEKTELPFAAEFEKLKAAVDKLEESHAKRLGELKTEDQKAALFEVHIREATPLAEKALALVVGNAQDPAAVEVLTWIIDRGWGNWESTVVEKAADLLIQHHLKDRRTHNVVTGFAHLGMPWTEKMLRALVAAELPAKEHALTLFQLAQCLQGSAEFVPDSKIFDARRLKRVELLYGKDNVAKMRMADAAKLEAEAIRLFTDVADNYGNVEYNLKKLRDHAASAIYIIRNIGIGKTAPEITGEDIDGKPMKLSDYRGKVVVLDFWGHW